MARGPRRRSPARSRRRRECRRRGTGVERPSCSSRNSPDAEADRQASARGCDEQDRRRDEQRRTRRLVARDRDEPRERQSEPAEVVRGLQDAWCRTRTSLGGRRLGLRLRLRLGLRGGAVRACRRRRRGPRHGRLRCRRRDGRRRHWSGARRRGRRCRASRSLRGDGRIRARRRARLRLGLRVGAARRGRRRLRRGGLHARCGVGRRGVGRMQRCPTRAECRAGGRQRSEDDACGEGRTRVPLPQRRRPRGHSPLPSSRTVRRVACLVNACCGTGGRRSPGDHPNALDHLRLFFFFIPPCSAWVIAPAR